MTYKYRIFEQEEQEEQEEPEVLALMAKEKKQGRSQEYTLEDDEFAGPSLEKFYEQEVRTMTKQQLKDVYQDFRRSYQLLVMKCDGVLGDSSKLPVCSCGLQLVTRPKHTNSKRRPSARNTIAAIERVHEAIVELNVKFLQQPLPTGTGTQPSTGTTTPDSAAPAQEQRAHQSAMPITDDLPAFVELNVEQTQPHRSHRGNGFTSLFKRHNKESPIPASVPQVPAHVAVPPAQSRLEPPVAKGESHQRAVANGQETPQVAPTCQHSRVNDLAGIWNEPAPANQPTTPTADPPEVSDDFKSLNISPRKDLARHLTQLRNKFVWATAFVEEFRRINDQDTAKHQYRVNAAFAGISAITSIVGAAKP
jgi:hypothetical protein